MKGGSGQIAPAFVILALLLRVTDPELRALLLP